jgi:hypothetical protein
MVHFGFNLESQKNKIQQILPASPTCPAEVLTKAEASAKAGKSCLK